MSVGYIENEWVNRCECPSETSTYSFLHETCVPRLIFCVHSRDDMYFHLRRSFIPFFVQKYFFHAEKNKSQKRTRSSAPLSSASLSPSIHDVARAHTMFKALPVIFRGVSAYLYRPRFRFYIASHRYAPQGTPASRAILSHDKRAINFCETAPSHPASAFHVCTSLSPFSSTTWTYVVYWFT